jgi:hypothetical protein
MMIDRLNYIISRLDAQDARVPNAALSSPHSVHDQAYHGFEQGLPPISQDSSESPSSQAHSHAKSRPDDIEDFMQIPSSRTNADGILLWPIFEGRYPPEYFVGILFETHSESSDEEFSSPPQKSSQRKPKATIGRPKFREDEVNELVEKFLSHVHIKNPILDVKTLRNYARGVVEDGPGWDGGSCLVVRSFQFFHPLREGRGFRFLLR